MPSWEAWCRRPHCGLKAARWQTSSTLPSSKSHTVTAPRGSDSRLHQLGRIVCLLAPGSLQTAYQTTMWLELLARVSHTRVEQQRKQLCAMRQLLEEATGDLDCTGYSASCSVHQKSPTARRAINVSANNEAAQQVMNRQELRHRSTTNSPVVAPFCQPWGGEWRC